MAENFDVELLYIEFLENFGPERGLTQRNDDFHHLDDDKFIVWFRFSKTTVVKILEHINDKLEYYTDRNKPLAPMQQLLLTLRFYATGSMKLVLRDLHGISQSTMSRYIRKVSDAIASLSHILIDFPQEEEREQIKHGFHAVGGFPGVVGAIDCTHIPIISPGGDIADIYRNSKGYFSINVQTVCDSKLVIRNIVAKWPGSIHDNYIFDNCKLKKEFEKGRINDCYLLGGNNYRLSRYLLTPFLNPSHKGEEIYNNSHTMIRNIVRHQCGMWKRRFPCLSLGLRTKLHTTLLIVVSTAVLHNIAIKYKEKEPPEDIALYQYLNKRKQFQEYGDVPVPHVIPCNHGPTAVFRQKIVEEHFLQA